MSTVLTGVNWTTHQYMGSMSKWRGKHIQELNRMPCTPWPILMIISKLFLASTFGSKSSIFALLYNNVDKLKWYCTYSRRRHNIIILADLLQSATLTYPTRTTMKFSVFAIAALAAAAATSSRCMVAAAAASRKRKVQKKTSSGPHGATESSGQPPGVNCKTTSDCAIPSGLDHPVCREGQCQSGASGSSCGVTDDCVKPPGLQHPVCRQGKCQRGACLDYCGNDSDCVSSLHCDGKTNIAKCHGYCCPHCCPHNYDGSCAS